jgi:hypothetical protein
MLQKGRLEWKSPLTSTTRKSKAKPKTTKLKGGLPLDALMADTRDSDRFLRIYNHSDRKVAPIFGSLLPLGVWFADTQCRSAQIWVITGTRLATYRDDPDALAIEEEETAMTYGRGTKARTRIEQAALGALSRGAAPVTEIGRMWSPIAGSDASAER